MPKGIAICGANGSGKTTLGRELAKILGFWHVDAEDYSFMESEIPFANARTQEEVRRLILGDIRKYGDFVFTAVNGDMGEEINAMYRCVVYLFAPREVRLARVKRRSFERFGERVLAGGDMYEREQGFFDFVASRSMDKVEGWLGTVKCPVIEADGRADVGECAAVGGDYLRHVSSFTYAMISS